MSTIARLTLADYDRMIDAAGRTAATVNPLGHRTTLGYDAAGRQTSTTDAQGNVSTTVYDQASRMVAQVNALGHRTTTVYDAAGQTWIIRTIRRATARRTRMTELAAARSSAWPTPPGRPSATTTPTG